MDKDRIASKVVIEILNHFRDVEKLKQFIGNNNLYNKNILNILSELIIDLEYKYDLFDESDNGLIVEDNEGDDEEEDEDEEVHYQDIDDDDEEDLHDHVD